MPLLDHEFVEWISGLDRRMKLNGREGKYVFKKALEQKLPSGILYRPKMGFAVPLSSWFRGPLRERVTDALLGGQLQQTGLFDDGFLRSLLERHQAGTHNFGAPIWALLMFEGFVRNNLNVTT